MPEHPSTGTKRVPVGIGCAICGHSIEQHRFEWVNGKSKVTRTFECTATGCACSGKVKP